MIGGQVQDQVAGLLDSMRAFAIPMRTRFRGITVREGALIEGPAGWGEFSPFAEYGPRECARWLACALEAATASWPAPVRGQVPVNVTVPAVGPARAHELVTASGCRTAKVKVAERGQSLADDEARVEAVRDALGGGGAIRVDANGAWDVGQAQRALRALGRFGLEYAEQPCATLGELAELRRRVDVPLAADESIRRTVMPRKRVRMGMANARNDSSRPATWSWTWPPVTRRRPGPGQVPAVSRRSPAPLPFRWSFRPLTLR